MLLVKAVCEKLPTGKFQNRGGIREAKSALHSRSGPSLTAHLCSLVLKLRAQRHCSCKSPIVNNVAMDMGEDKSSRSDSVPSDRTAGPNDTGEFRRTRAEAAYTSQSIGGHNPREDP